MPIGSHLLPHGGGLVAVLIASIVLSIFAAVVATELHRNIAVWMISAFVVTFVVVSAGWYIATR